MRRRRRWGYAARDHLEGRCELALNARVAIRLLLIVLLSLVGSFASAAQTLVKPPVWQLQARVVAVGIPGIAGLRQVGRFHLGGPIPGNPEFFLQTGAGRVLDPLRLLVTSTSNFGAPPATPGHATGAVLSLFTGGDRPLVVPHSFAASGGQAQAAKGAIQLYAAQSPAFANGRHNGGSRTAEHTSASGPRYLSINNAFGRPWIANAPFGMPGIGSVSVVDPDGAPLANAPSGDAGGVFAGRATDRRTVLQSHATTLLAKAISYRKAPQLTAGTLERAALGTAFLGASPDGTGLAVFAVATAEGAIAQIHVQDGVDGLAPPGSVLPSEPEGGSVIGMAFKWNPQRVLYVTDPGRDRLLLLQLEDDRRQFIVAGMQTIAVPQLHEPIDIAATLPEIANPGFASHTTLAGGSDLYVANRGDGSLLRLSHEGKVLALATIGFTDGTVLGPKRLRALAVSADAQRLWLSLQGEVPGYPGMEGAVIEVSAFDSEGPYGTSNAQVQIAPDPEIAVAGERAFQQVFTPDTGLGPLFNERSCVACHPGPGGASLKDEHFVLRIARMDDQTGRVSSVDHPNSPVARRHSTRELGELDAPSPALPRKANVVSLRMPLDLFNIGAIDSVLDSSIEHQAVSKGDGIKGRVNYVKGQDGALRVGRFGWKGDIGSLEQMVAEAFSNELGIESATSLRRTGKLEDDGRLVQAVAAYLRSLKAPSKERP